jgi:hypothetical protein
MILVSWDSIDDRPETRGEHSLQGLYSNRLGAAGRWDEKNIFGVHGNIVLLAGQDGFQIDWNFKTRRGVGDRS